MVTQICYNLSSCQVLAGYMFPCNIRFRGGLHDLADCAWMLTVLFSTALNFESGLVGGCVGSYMFPCNIGFRGACFTIALGMQAMPEAQLEVKVEGGTPDASVAAPAVAHAVSSEMALLPLHEQVVNKYHTKVEKHGHIGNYLRSHWGKDKLPDFHEAPCILDLTCTCAQHIV